MEDFSKLKEIERVRKRPAVIFGGTGLEGYRGVIKEVLKFALVETETKEKTCITVELKADNSIKLIIDNTGVKIDEFYPELNRFDWELVFTELWGRTLLTKKDETSEEGILLGLPEAFVCAVQFCCEFMNVTVVRNGTEHTLHFENGVNIGGLKSEKTVQKKESTEIEFKIDSKILGEVNISEDIEYFNTFLEGCSLTGKNCFVLRFYKGEHRVERAYRNGHRCG